MDVSMCYKSRQRHASLLQHRIEKAQLLLRENRIMVPVAARSSKLSHCACGHAFRGRRDKRIMKMQFAADASQMQVSRAGGEEEDEEEGVEQREEGEEELRAGRA